MNNNHKCIINNRLKSLSDFLYSNNKIIDIGCDHALLSIYIYQNITKNVVGSDINKEPLKKAKENLKKFDLENKIELRLGNGLDTVKDEDTVVISGMGGLTINKILDDLYKHPSIKRLILSPNTDFEETRKNTQKLGFNLKKEIIVEENNKYYLISVYEKEETKQKICSRFGKLDFKEENTIKYYNQILEKNDKIIEKLPKFKLKRIKLILENKGIKRKLLKK